MAFQDIFGQDILPGHILAVRRRSKGSSLDLYIATSLGPASKSQQRYGFSGKVRVLRLAQYSDTLSGSYINLKTGFNNDVVIIEPSNVFLSLQNKKVARLFSIVDAGKSSGKLPEDYKLGKPWTEEQVLID